MKTLAILGASGHGKVLADIALKIGFEHIHFFDDRWPELTQCGEFPVMGDTPRLLESCTTYDGIAIGIGNNTIRLVKFQEIKALGCNFPSLIHPSATVSSSVKMGAGSVVMAGAVINPDTVIGDVCIINTLASVDHDCTLENGVHICPRVALAGGVKVGKKTWVGIGTSIVQGIQVGHESMIGAGSVVISDIPSNKTYFGVPAREHCSFN